MGRPSRDRFLYDRGAMAAARQHRVVSGAVWRPRAIKGTEGGCLNYRVAWRRLPQGRYLPG